MRRSITLALVALAVLLVPAAALGATERCDPGDGNGIRGTITDTAGNPIEYIGVRGFKLIDGDWQEAFFAYTSAAGVYEMPTGGQQTTVRLYFYQKHVTAEEATWRPEWYDDAADFDSADSILVPTGTWVTANAVLAGPGSIIGTVTDAATGDPIEGIQVRAYLAEEARSRLAAGARCEQLTVLTGPDGTYEITPLRAGAWTIEFRDPNHLWADQWSGGGMIEDQATPYIVRQDAATRIDAALLPGGGLAVYPALADSGERATARYESGIGEACIDAFDSSGTQVAGRSDTWDWVFTLPAGDYYFRFSDCSIPVDYATTWYPSAPTFEEAEPIGVIAGQWNGEYFIYTAGRCDGEVPTIVGTPGADSIIGTGNRDIIATGSGDDTVFSGDGNDLICLGEGNDLGNGSAGADWIYGGLGNDVLRGGDGPDSLYGGGGLDRLLGGGGTDSLFGLAGADLLMGGEGNDLLDGGLGRNSASFAEAPGPVSINLATGDARGEGFDTLLGIGIAIGSPFGDRLAGDGGANRLVGGEGDDNLLGGDGDDFLIGSGGNDSIAAGPGDDSLIGRTGDDTLLGGSGIDLLRGGPGDDSCALGEILVGC